MRQADPYCLTVGDVALHLLPEKAIYIEQLKALLVSDVHLGKSETFQVRGVPISNAVNQTTLDRLRAVCDRYAVDDLYILGDLFHSRYALVEEVINPWRQFVDTVKATVHLLVGNHDRALVPKLQQLEIQCSLEAIQLDSLVLSHEPEPKSGYLNICGHIHPCLRIKTKLDNLRLPCFYLEQQHHQLVLPSFGEFTGGYEVDLHANAIAYVIAEQSVIPFAGKP